MSRKAKRKFRHLSTEDRIKIQGYIEIGKNISEIARILGFNKSTISREIRNRSNNILGGSFPCSIRDKIGLCNTCTKQGICSRYKSFYDYERARKDAYKKLKESRAKSYLNKVDIKYINDTISPLIKENKQGIRHIYYSDDKLRSLCSESTIRRLIFRGELSVKAHELKLYVRRKDRKYPKKDDVYHIKKAQNLIGRTYSDYLEYIKNNKERNIVEFDSVIGKREDNKAILTITFPKYSFQFGLLIDKGSPTSVINKLKALLRNVNINVRDALFQVLLSDNGSEFSSFYELEELSSSIKVFYTRPNVATDKSRCERNHEFVRDKFPKGKSLDNVTQEMLDDAFSNINSYVRKKLKNKTPYDALTEAFKEDITVPFYKVIKIKRIENKKVNMRNVI